MNKDQLIKEINEKCISANPDLLKLEFGCRVFLKNRNITITIVDRFEGDPLFIDYFNGGPQICMVPGYMNDDLVEILGKEPQLSDVLLAIDSKLPCGSWIITTQYLCFHDAYTDEELCTWELRKGLYDQSLETIQFIHSLLFTK